jgi:hypothetical protein
MSTQPRSRFERGELRDQHAGQARQALLVLPGVVLLAGRRHAQHQVLGDAHLARCR